LLLFFLVLAPLARCWSEVGDPVGYATFRLVAGEKGAIGLNLVKGYSVLGDVVAVGEDFVEFPSLPGTLTGPGGSAFLEIRTGAGAGMTLEVSGATGNRVHLKRSPLGWIAPGDKAGVRPDWTIGELFRDPAVTGILAGESHLTADTVGIFDAETQAMRVFFYQADAGWREVGRESDGDMADVPIPFPLAPLYHRRGSASLEFLTLGAVPMPYDVRRKVYVRPGRNLISSPFTSVQRVADWLDPASVVSGPSAPRSDSMKLIFPQGGESRVFYHRKNRGWRFAGGQQDASDASVDIVQAVDFQRVGPAGYLDFQTIAPVQAKSAAIAPAGNLLPIDPSATDFVAGLVGWKSKAGRSYQLQIQSAGSTVWRDHGAVVAAQGDITRSLCRPEGNGLIRVLELP
jgi:hypothetical protein